MNTSANCREAIKGFEGLTLAVKPDCGHEEIGYGHDLLPGENYPDGIDEAKAETLLTDDLAKVDVAINSHNLTLTQGQHDALADFTFECGTGALEQLLGHGLNQVPLQLPRWIHGKVNGVETIMPGMMARRMVEVNWWNSEN
jgi:GH24 family phage-related lysozyme (muramidase)